MRLALLALVLVSLPALARPWNGVDPGVSKKSEVTAKFGQPTKVVTLEGQQVLAYLGKQAIRGTTQAQFKIDPRTQVVQRIDVFPGPKLDKSTIENSYGPACPEGTLPPTPCYLKKVTDDFRVYFHYPRLGLAVFFNQDGKTVNSFIFTPQRTR